MRPPMKRGIIITTSVAAIRTLKKMRALAIWTSLIETMDTRRSPRLATATARCAEHSCGSRRVTMTTVSSQMISFALLVLAAVPVAPPHPTTPQPAQSFNLDSGDFRWVPFTVHQTPTGVDCRFEVVAGNATVHAELLPLSEFRRFDRGLEHETMASTPQGRTGAFRRVINTPGQYAVVLVNQKGAEPVTVSLNLETNANPGNSDISTTLAPERRRTVIALSVAFFLVTITWSGSKLIAAMRNGR
jgi:hypothetical protein